MRRSTTAQAGATPGSRHERPTRTAPAAPDHADASIRLERRGSGRSKARGQGVATFIHPDGRLWLTRVHLVDRSAGGLGVRAHVPAPAGASFTLTCDGATRHGVVTHSRARGGTYRLGLRCASRAAA